MARIRLALLFGGRSTEHQISCVSAGSLMRAIDRDKYDVVPVGIAPDGRWVLGPSDPEALSRHGRELPSVDPAAAGVVLPADPTSGGLIVADPTTGAQALRGVDVVFPLLHGPFGEDGTIQGLLEMAGIPYVGSGVFASAAAMDKHHMKVMLEGAGLAVSPYVAITDRAWRHDRAQVLESVAALGLPVFVKPARGGSSIGITKVDVDGDLEKAVEEARLHDPKVIVEAAVPGREIECGVLDSLGDGPPEASLPAEIVVTGGQDFYDFEAKYLDDATRTDVPADLDAETTARVRAAAVRAFSALDCEGLARVDFFLVPGGDLVVNEVNTMPGFTPVSMFPQMWAATGLDYPALVDRLVALALARGTGLR